MSEGGVHKRLPDAVEEFPMYALTHIEFADRPLLFLEKIRNIRFKSMS